MLTDIEYYTFKLRRRLTLRKVAGFAACRPYHYYIIFAIQYPLFFTHTLKGPQLREKLPITHILTSSPRFHNHPFLVTKILHFSTYPNKAHWSCSGVDDDVLELPATPLKAQMMYALSSWTHRLP